MWVCVSEGGEGGGVGAMDAEAISVAEMARLNWRLGEVYADAVEKAQAQVWGEGRGWWGVMGRRCITRAAAAKYLGKAVRCYVADG